MRQRVASGGHNIPEDTIIRRYHRGRTNLIESYLPLCDTWILYNNSSFLPELVAEKGIKQNPIIYINQTYSQIMEQSE